VKYSARGYFELLELWWRSRRRRRWLSDVPGVLAKDNRNKRRKLPRVESLGSYDDGV